MSILEESQTIDPILSSSPCPERTLAVFDSFSVRDWYSWLRGFLRGFPTDPEIRHPRTEPHVDLLSLYYSFSSYNTRDRFLDALGYLYQCYHFHKDDTEILYYLLQLICVLKPLGLRDNLRRDLLDEVYMDISFERQQCHALLFRTNAAYSLDEELIEYAVRSVSTMFDLSYGILCFRILSSTRRYDATKLLFTIVPRISSFEDASALALEFKAELLRIGARELCTWYTESFESMLASHLNAFDLLERAMIEHLYPLLAIMAPKDPYAHVLSQQLLSLRSQMTADDIIELARYASIVGEALAVAAIANMSLNYIAQDEEHRPWHVFDGNTFPDLRIAPEQVSVLADKVVLRFYPRSKGERLAIEKAKTHCVRKMSVWREIRRSYAGSTPAGG